MCDASDDERARELIHSLAQTFNLKQHGVSGLRANSNLPSKEEEIQLYTPLDLGTPYLLFPRLIPLLEVHLAADQRYYLVDTGPARLLPPSSHPPSPSMPSSSLQVRLPRPQVLPGRLPHPSPSTRLPS